MGAAIYAGENGLVMVDGNGEVTLLTKDLYTIEQWQSLDPHTMVGIVHEGYYYGSTETTTIRLRLPDNIHLTPNNAPLTTLSLRINAFWKSKSGRLYFTTDEGTFWWGQGDDELTMTWRSRPWILPELTRLSAYKVVADESGNEISHWAGSHHLQTDTHESNQPRRLKAGFRSLEWQMQIEGTAEVVEYDVKQSITDLGSSQ
jgi:hypothetical protein